MLMETQKIQDIAMYSIKNYSSFKILKYNRPVDKTRIEGLMQSIKTNGFLLPILVSNDMQVADGQHRLEAAKRLNVAVNYIKYNITGDNLPLLVSKLNSLSKNWTALNYYMMWKELGKEVYVWMGDVIESYDITFEELFTLIKCSLTRTIDKFKDGTFTFTATQRQRIIDLIKRFNYIINFNKTFREEGFGVIFRKAVLKVVVHPDYDEERMTKKLKKDAGRILGCVNKIDFIAQLELMYNHGERNPIYFIKSKTKTRRTSKAKLNNHERVLS